MRSTPLRRGRPLLWSRHLRIRPTTALGEAGSVSREHLHVSAFAKSHPTSIIDLDRAIIRPLVTFVEAHSTFVAVQDPQIGAAMARIPKTVLDRGQQRAPDTTRPRFGVRIDAPELRRRGSIVVTCRSER